MVTVNRLLALALPLAILAPRLAHADGEEGAPSGAPMQPQPQQPQIPVGQAPAPAQVYTPLYTAPLSQQTQTTYVPQSVALSGPDEIDDVEDGRRAPVGYTEVHRKRKGMLLGGAITLAASYSLSALIAATGQDDSSYNGGTNSEAAMWIPVAGPFIQIGQSNSATENVFLVGLGAAQVAGAVMLYLGATSTKRVFVRNDLVSNVAVTPMAGPNGATGLSLSGKW